MPNSACFSKGVLVLGELALPLDMLLASHGPSSCRSSLSPNGSKNWDRVNDEGTWPDVHAGQADTRCFAGSSSSSPFTPSIAMSREISLASRWMAWVTPALPATAAA